MNTTIAMLLMALLILIIIVFLALAIMDISELKSKVKGLEYDLYSKEAAIYKEIKRLSEQDMLSYKEVLQENMEYLFPELKESEEERIRKAIISLVRQSSEILEKKNQEQMIAWLEKQGVQKPAGKIEPKFHEGEWITNGDYTWKIVEVKPLDYILQSQDGNIVDDTISHVDKQFHSFTIEDAKDGDVLACNNGWTCIFKTLVNDETFSSYCFMDSTKWFCETGGECHTLREEFVISYNGKMYPATKEQRDLLFQKMKEAGYEWDAEKKELKKIEKKPTWSEEDEHRIKDAMYFLDTAKKHYASTVEIDACIDWLKSLKQRK